MGGCDGEQGRNFGWQRREFENSGGARRFKDLDRQWAGLVMPRIRLGSAGGASSSGAGFRGAVGPVRKQWEGRRA